MKSNEIAVIGAGITGLTAAYFLEKSGANVSLFDRSKTPGGAIKTVSERGWQYELGPNTLLLREKIVSDFIDELGLADEVVEANPDASSRFIVKNSMLLALGGSPIQFFKTPLFSGKGKLRLLGEPFVSKSSDEKQTVAEFVEKRFGRELLDYAVNPFVAGIHAGRPDKLSVKHAFPVLHEIEQEYGSVLAGAIIRAIRPGNLKKEKTGRKLISFKKGLASLPLKIADELNSQIRNHEVEAIKKRGDEWWLQWEGGEAGPFSRVVCTVPLHKWNEKLLPVEPEELQVIKKVYHPPLSVLQLGFNNNQISHPLNGFGFLVPEIEERNILGALFSSTLFQNRAPVNNHLLTVFVGGARQPELADKQGDEMLNMVMSDLSDLLGITGQPVFKEHIFWPHAIPQYDLNHDRVLEVFDDIEERNPGLHLAGNFRGGISVPDCIKNGIKLAEMLTVESSL